MCVTFSYFEENASSTHDEVITFYRKTASTLYDMQELASVRFGLMNMIDKRQ